MEPYFVVWNEQHGKPTYKHVCRDDADAEAKRLAGLYPGSEFHVLMLLGVARKVDVEYVGVDCDPPF